MSICSLYYICLLNIVYLIYMFRFLPYLMKEFSDLGGQFFTQKVNSLKELKDFDVVVNCSGSGARDLVKDKALQPLRGQVLVSNKELIRADL